MRRLLLRAFKRSLTEVGARVSPGALHQAQLMINYMRLGRWMRQHGFVAKTRVKNKREVFDVVASRVRDKPVLYLEFGVFEGKSMRYWSQALRHPQSMLHGFDSFEGLPEDFDMEGSKYMRAAFDVGGAIPRIDDPRVRFFKGWFDEVLPTYEVPEHETLIINIDADLYSSTTCVLKHLRPHIGVGTMIYFDDMSRPDHEPRAFHEFMEETGLHFELIAVDQSLNTAFFECVEPARGAARVAAPQRDHAAIGA